MVDHAFATADARLGFARLFLMDCVSEALGYMFGQRQCRLAHNVWVEDTLRRLPPRWSRATRDHGVALAVYRQPLSELKL